MPRDGIAGRETAEDGRDRPQRRRGRSRKIVEVRCERGAEIATCVATARGHRHSHSRISTNIGRPRLLLVGSRETEISLLGPHLLPGPDGRGLLHHFWPDVRPRVPSSRRGRWFDPQSRRCSPRVSTRRCYFGPAWAATTCSACVAARSPRHRALGRRALLGSRGRSLRPRRRRQIALDVSAFHTASPRSPWACAGNSAVSHELERDLRRAALLHDIGKLGISNLILDKPGKPTDGGIRRFRVCVRRNVRPAISLVAGLGR